MAHRMSVLLRRWVGVGVVVEGDGVVHDSGRGESGGGDGGLVFVCGIG